MVVWFFYIIFFIWYFQINYYLDKWFTSWGFRVMISSIFGKMTGLMSGCFHHETWRNHNSWTQRAVGGKLTFLFFLFFKKKRKKKGKGTKGKLPIRNRVKEHFSKTAFIEIQNLTGFTIHWPCKYIQRDEKKTVLF